MPGAGCPALDSNFVSVSNTSQVSVNDVDTTPAITQPGGDAYSVVTSDSADPASVAPPASVSYSSPVLPPTSVEIEATTSAPPTSSVTYDYTPPVIYMPSASYGPGAAPGVYVTYQYNPGPGEDLDPPDGVPETSSIMMIGSGLAFLGLAATTSRRRSKI